jgi:hypothetical protein
MSLSPRLTADEHRRLRERPIDNVHAYERYLKARHPGMALAERRHRRCCAAARERPGHQLAWSNSRTVNQLKHALAVEPGNNDAMALLSNCYAISGQMSAARSPNAASRSIH